MKREIVTVYFRTNSDNNRMCGYTDSPDEFQISDSHRGCFILCGYKDITIYGAVKSYAQISLQAPAE